MDQFSRNFGQPDQNFCRTKISVTDPFLLCDKESIAHRNRSFKEDLKAQQGRIEKTDTQTHTGQLL